MNNRKDYPRSWKRIAWAAKERAGWRCERCHIQHGTQRVSAWTGNRYRVWLHAAHVHPGDTGNERPELMALCPSCHWHYDNRQKATQLERLKHRALIAEWRLQHEYC